MEQLILILLVALISIINWIVQKSKQRREQRKLEKRADTTGERGLAEPPPPETQTETAMRRLREALGLPEEAEPPIIPERARREAPPAREPTPPPFPRPAKKAPVARVPFTPPRLEYRKFHLPHLEHRKFDLPHRLAKPVAEVEVRRQPSRIRELLGSAGGLRDAVVLAEILGPPKSLRQGDFRP
jgi:hypothetical protein